MLDSRRQSGSIITPAGLEFIQAVLPEQARVVENMFAALGDEDVETLRLLLKKATSTPENPPSAG